MPPKKNKTEKLSFLRTALNKPSMMPETLICLGLLSIVAFADEIFLSNGESAQTTIVDTNGCDVRIYRNFDTIPIRKKNIQKIIWGADTISFTGFVCAETKKAVIKYEDTPEYQLMVLLDKAKKSSRGFKENSTIAFLYAPLLGNYNAEEFAGVQQYIMALLNKKAKSEFLSPSEVLETITGGQNRFHYVFLTTKYHVEIHRFKNKVFGSATGFHASSNNFLGAPGINAPPQKQATITTVADFILYDISNQEIVYQKAITVKKYVWGESDYTFTGMLTPENWKNEMKKAQIDRRLNKNAQSIRKQMVKGLSVYLGIK